MEDLLELDATALLAASRGAVRERRLAEVRDLRVVAQWAVLHSADPTVGPGGAVQRRLGNRLVVLGGEGTPGVQDFCLGEIATARGTGVSATSNALGDVLDLIHRLPRTWSVCESGQAEVWVARKVAKLSRHLPRECVGVVDAAVSRMIATQAGGRVIAVAEAKIIEAAPTLHEQRAEQERRRRYVSVSRTDEAGLRTVIARVQAGDAVWVKATLDRVGEIIAPRHLDATADEVRSIAFGYLARPAELLTLLLEHTEPPHHDATSQTAEPETAEPETAEPSRATAFPADLLAALGTADLSRLAPRCTLYVHLHEATLLGAPGVARVEGLGPVALSGLQQLLGRTALVIRPVIDLSERVRTTAYEHPESLKERIHLTTGGDYWPYATATTRTPRGVDYDHPTPYRDPHHGGPPGQTGTHNSGPLTRRHHRWKTHAGYRARQSGHGRYAWLTPHGLAFLIDHHGTRPIDPTDAHTIIDAPPGVDIYPSDLGVDWAVPSR